MTNLKFRFKKGDKVFLLKNPDTVFTVVDIDILSNDIYFKLKATQKSKFKYEEGKLDEFTFWKPNHEVESPSQRDKRVELMIREIDTMLDFKNLGSYAEVCSSAFKLRRYKDYQVYFPNATNRKVQLYLQTLDNILDANSPLYETKRRQA